MTKTSSCWRFAAAVSPLALIIAGSPAMAAGKNPAGTGEEHDRQPRLTSPLHRPTRPRPTRQENTIVITGFRASLRSSTAKKKNAETVVESVNAEDIGKLPDNSIAELIGRLPGVAAQRNNGRAQIISIRGFGPDFSTTTLNGRQQTTTNDSRAVEFDQYPSEVLAGVDIYKTGKRTTPPAASSAASTCGLSARSIMASASRRSAFAAFMSTRSCCLDSNDKGVRVFRHLRRPVRRQPRRRRPFGSLHQRPLPDA